MICFNFVNSYLWFFFFKFNYRYCVINDERVSVTSAYLFDGWFDSEGNIQSRLSFYPKNKQKPVYQRNQHIYFDFTMFQAISSHHIEGQWTRWNTLRCCCLHLSRHVPVAHFFHRVSKLTSAMRILVCA